MKRNPLAVVAKITRMDGWKNILTGLGIRGRDRRKESKIEWDLMTESEADELFSASDIARKIVTEVVNDAFREGYELKAESMDPKLTKDLEDEEQRLQINAKMIEAWILARMYGGSGIVVMPRDVSKLATPYIPEQVAEIQSLLVLSQWELPRQLIETDIRSPNFARPRSYRITPRTGGNQMNEEVHHTRVLRFDGSYLPRIKFFQNNLWHDSILNTCKVAIRDYDAALSAVSATLDDFSVAVMKMKGLANSLSEDRDDLITKRLEITNLSRSIAKMIVIDADTEEFQYQDRQLSGVADCVKLVAGRLVVASDMPHTKILGESPQGSNATGNSTTKDWYDHVKSQQKNYLDKRLLTLWSWVLSAKKSPTKGKVPVGLKAIYAPLWQEPQSVLADIRLKTSQADASDINAGILEPSEVAVSRYGTGEYSVETQLVDDRSSQNDVLPDKLDPKNPDNDPLNLKKKPPGDNSDPNDPAEANPTEPFKPNVKATNEIEEKEATV